MSAVAPASGAVAISGEHPTTVAPNAPTAEAVTAKAAAANIDPTKLVGRRVKLKDGREGTIQVAGAGLDRFEVQLDNGSTVRLRGPNAEASPAKVKDESSAAALVVKPPAMRVASKMTESQVVVGGPSLELQVRREDGSRESFAAPNLAPQSGSKHQFPTVDLGMTAAALSLQTQEVHSPPFEEPTPQVLARILMDCHLSPRATPSPSAGSGQSQLDLTGSLLAGAGAGSPPYLHLQTLPKVAALPQPVVSGTAPAQLDFQRFSGTSPSASPSLSLEGLESSPSKSHAGRKSSRIQKQLNVQGLGGGSTPRRRQTEESVREAQSPRGGVDTSLSGSLAGMSTAAVVGKRVVTRDGRHGIVLSSGHGFLAVQFDAVHGGGVTKLRAHQLEEVSPGHQAPQHSFASNDEEEECLGDESVPVVENEDLFPQRKYDARLQYRGSDESDDDHDALRKKKGLAKDLPEGSDEEVTFHASRDGYFHDRGEEEALYGGPLGPPTEAQRNAMAAERSRPTYSGAAVDLVGKHVRLPDSRTGEVLSSGHGFFTIQLQRGGLIKMRGNQLVQLEDGEAGGEDGGETWGQFYETAERNVPAAMPVDKTPRKPPRNRGPPEVVQRAAQQIDENNPPLPNAKMMIGRAVRMPDNRVGVVTESGHGFFSIDIDENDGGGFIKLRGNQLSLVDDSAFGSHAGGGGGGGGGPNEQAGSLKERTAKTKDRAREQREARARARSSADLSQRDPADGGDDLAGGSGAQAVLDGGSELLAHSGDVERLFSNGEFECSLRISKVLAEAPAPAEKTEDEATTAEETTESVTAEPAAVSSDLSPPKQLMTVEPMVSIGDLVSLVCLIDCRRRAAYIVTDLKDKLHQRFQYCRISGYGRPVPMVATSNLPATLSLLTRHSAVSEDNVAEFLASLRHAWLQDVLSQVRSGKVHDWRMSSASQATGNGKAELTEEEKLAALGETKWYKLDWSSVWMQAQSAGWTTERGVRRTDLFYIPPVAQPEAAAADDDGANETPASEAGAAEGGEAAPENEATTTAAAAVAEVPTPLRISSRDEVRRHLATNGLSTNGLVGMSSQQVSASKAAAKPEAKERRESEAGGNRATTFGAESPAMFESENGGEDGGLTVTSSDDQMLQFDMIAIRVTKHVPLRIALRDIVAIVCRVGMKRAGGRVNKLKLKLPPGIVMLHTFGTTSPRRPTAVIQSTQLSDALAALPSECVSRFRESGDEGRLRELMFEAEAKQEAVEAEQNEAADVGTDTAASRGAGDDGETSAEAQATASPDGSDSRGIKRSLSEDHGESAGKSTAGQASPPAKKQAPETNAGDHSPESADSSPAAVIGDISVPASAQFSPPGQPHERSPETTPQQLQLAEKRLRLAAAVGAQREEEAV